MADEIREQREQAAEVKFLMTPAVGEAVRAWARARLQPDPHGSGPEGDRYRTTSLYFDTTAFDVFHRRGSFGRTKYRIRRYGSSDVAFLERKLRTPRRLSKRRSPVPLTDLSRITDDPQAGDGAWSGEWFRQRLATRRLQPVCQITYERTARVASTPYGIARLTIDEDVRAALADEVAFTPPSGALVAASAVILELKYRCEMPAVFKHLVEEFALNPASVSKYRRSAGMLGLARERDAACQTS